MSKTADLARIDSALLTPWGFRNKLINGKHQFWQRATAQSTPGYGSVDRWKFDWSALTVAISRQEFSVGQTVVPGNPLHYVRMALSAGFEIASERFIKTQRIEGVATLAGQKAVLSFYAKAAAVASIGIELSQRFGTGGSPSADVTGIAFQKIDLTTEWKLFEIKLDIPSVAGKVTGTGGDDSLDLNFWLHSGSGNTARAPGISNRSGTFDIAMVQLEAGHAATPFEDRPLALERILCQRFREHLIAHLAGYGAAGTFVANSFPFKVSKRGSSQITLSGANNVNVGTVGTASNIDSVTLSANVTAAGSFQIYNGTVAADCELP